MGSRCDFMLWQTLWLRGGSWDTDQKVGRHMIKTLIRLSNYLAAALLGVSCTMPCIVAM